MHLQIRITHCTLLRLSLCVSALSSLVTQESKVIQTSNLTKVFPWQTRVVLLLQNQQLLYNCKLSRSQSFTELRQEMSHVRVRSWCKHCLANIGNLHELTTLSVSGICIFCSWVMKLKKNECHRNFKCVKMRSVTEVLVIKESILHVLLYCIHVKGYTLIREQKYCITFHEMCIMHCHFDFNGSKIRRYKLPYSAGAEQPQESVRIHFRSQRER